MGCKGCKEQDNMQAKDCPKCGRRFIGSQEICGYCYAADKEAVATAKDAEIVEDK
jgi:uncharacterized OB-fold protein